MISGQPPCSWLMYIFSTTRCSLLPSVSKAASRMRVAPISPARIMIQFSSIHDRHVPSIRRPPSAPTYLLRNWEICAAVVPSRHQVWGRRCPSRLRPCLHAGKAWHQRSCSHTAKPRTRYWRPPRNTWSIQNSYPPILLEGQHLGSWRQNLAISLLSVESV